MATNRTIKGLSGAGFRVPDSTGALKKLTENNSLVVDVDDLKTQRILNGERDNFIRTKEKGTFTVTIASPGVFSKTGHGLTTGDIVQFSTTGALPTGLTAGTNYYIIAGGLTADAFEVSATSGGSAVNTSGSQSGTHTVTPVSVNIVGLTQYGIRIKTTASSVHPYTVKLGSGVHVIDLSDGRRRRTLKRSYGRYIVSTNAASVSIRGTQKEQNGFDIADGSGAGDGSVLITSSNVDVTAADVVVVGSKTYTFKSALSEAKATDTVTTSGTPASTRASGTVTTSGTGAANNDTLVIGGVTYTFKTTLTGAANEVLRDGTEDHDLTNLKAAINAEAGAGTTYGTGTVANPAVTCGAVGSHAVTITAVSYKASIGNAIALTKTGAVFTVSGSGTLASGVNETVNVNGHTYTFVEALDAGVADEVLINGQDTSLDNLRAAINASSGAGTTYGTGTVVNADVTCGARSSHTVTLTAKALGTAANSYTLAVVGSHLSRGAATFSGGVNAIANEVLVDGTANGSLSNLADAINAANTVGTKYSTGTTANADATAGAVNTTAHTLTLSAVEGGSQTIVVTTTAVTYTLSAGVLTDSLVKLYRLQTATVDPQHPTVYTQLRRHYKSWIEA